MKRYFFVTCLLLLAGCATFRDSRRMESLENTVISYQSNLRWGHYSRVVYFLDDRGREQQELTISKLRDIRIISSEVLDMNISDDRAQAYRTVELKYYSLNSPIEKSLIDRQLWEYDPTEQRWYLQSGLPDF